MADRDQLDKWLAEVDALLAKGTDMPQVYEDVPDGEGGTSNELVDRPAYLIDSLINVPPTEDEDAAVILIPRDEPIEDHLEDHPDLGMIHRNKSKKSKSKKVDE